MIGAVRKGLLITCLGLLFTGQILAQTTNTNVYIYDKLGRLVAVVDPTGEAAVYSYDAAGNIVSITRRASAEVSIIEFTPDKGSTGTSVTIYGTGFSTVPSENTIRFNGMTADVISASATQLVTSVPLGASTGPISVTTPNGFATSASPFNINLAPTITGFTPTIGIAANLNGAGGTSVTINGTNFESTPSNNDLSFNITDAQANTADATTISTMVPYTATSGRISVETPNGVATSGGDFFVPPAPFVPTDVGFTGRMAVGEAKTVTLGTSNKIGLLLFDGTIGQNISFNISGVTISNSNITIYRPNGSVLLTSTSINTSGRFLDTQELTAAGTYTILIDPTSTNTGSMTITLNAIVDATGTIEVDGPSVTATTTVPGQNARLIFSGVQGQRLGLNLTGVTMSSNVSIFNPDGTSFLQPTIVTTSGRFIETTNLPISGIYTILIDPQNAVTGSMTLALTSLPPDVNATITIDGPPVTVTVTGPGQNATVTFAGTAGERVSLNLTNVTISSSSVTVRKPDGTILWSAATVTTSGVFFDTVTLPATGTYSIFIDPKIAATGSMTLTLSSVPLDETGTIVIGGPPVTVAINTPGQNAQLTFAGTAGQIIELDRQGTISLSGSSLSIRKPDGTVLQDTYGFSFSDQIYLLPVAGTYTIDINPTGATTGNITFTLYEIPQPVTGTITVDGPPLTVTIPTAGQIAKITFQGNAGERVSLKAHNIKTGPWGSYVEVKAPDGSIPGWIDFADPEVFFDDDYFDYYNFADTMILPATGTYTITIFPDVDTSGSMDLTLYSVPPDITGTITPGGPPVTVTTTVPGQDARLTFSGTEGQRVSLKVTSVFPFTPYTCLLGPDGFVVGGTVCVENFQGHPTFWDSAVLPTTGTYTIRVNGIYAGVGSATVTLYDLPPVITGTLTVGGPPVTVTATAPGQDAEMTFTGTAGQRVSLKVSGTLPVFSTVAILRATGNLPLNSQNRPVRQIGPDRAALIETLVLPATATYRVRVNTWNDVGTMTFNLYEVPADVNDGAISLDGPAVTVTSSAERQNRRLTFEGTAGQVVNLRINNDVSWLNQVWIFRPDGILHAGLTADAASTKFIDTVLPINGNYSIVTELFANGDAVTLTLGSGTSDLTGTAILNGQPTTITLPAAQQNARYSFNGTAGQRVGIKTNEVTLTDARVTITGQELECCLQHIVRNEGHARDRFSVRQITTTGPNALVVDPLSDYTGSITTRLYDIPPDVTGTITPNGPPVTVTTTTPGQNAILTFNGTTGQQVTIHVTNNTAGKITIDLLRPTGANQAYQLSSGSSFDLPVQSLPTAGTYSIVINPSRANTGSVTVSVTSF